MGLIGRLKSNGVMLVYNQIDELSYPNKNVGISSDGTFYGSLFNENVYGELNQNTPLRIKSDKTIIARNYFDEASLSTNVITIFESLRTLSPILDSISDVTRTDFKNVQVSIEASNSTFNVFAVVTKYSNSEFLQGVGTINGRNDFTSPGFVFNSTDSNVLSTGKEIVPMSGGIDNGVSFIDGKRWMGMVVYDGTSQGYRGMMLWVFTDDIIDGSNNIYPDSRVISTTKSIFSPTISPLSYSRVYQVIINADGLVFATDVSGNAGWNYSSNQYASEDTGYYSTSSFSFDDGIWAFILGGKASGNSGPDYKTINGYGFGNVNAKDSNAFLYWNGAKISENNYVGFVFTSDA